MLDVFPNGADLIYLKNKTKQKMLKFPLKSKEGRRYI